MCEKFEIPINEIYMRKIDWRNMKVRLRKIWKGYERKIMGHFGKMCVKIWYK